VAVGGAGPAVRFRPRHRGRDRRCQITGAALADLASAEGQTPWVAVKATAIDHWPV